MAGLIKTNIPPLFGVVGANWCGGEPKLVTANVRVRAFNEKEQQKLANYAISSKLDSKKGMKQILLLWFNEVA